MDPREEKQTWDRNTVDINGKILHVINLNTIS